MSPPWIRLLKNPRDVDTVPPKYHDADTVPSKSHHFKQSAPAMDSFTRRPCYQHSSTKMLCYGGSSTRSPTMDTVPPEVPAMDITGLESTPLQEDPGLEAEYCPHPNRERKPKLFQITGSVTIR